MTTPELKEKRDIRLNVLIEKFQKKLKEAKRMANKAEKKRKAMEYAPNRTNTNVTIDNERIRT